MIEGVEWDESKTRCDCVDKDRGEEQRKGLLGSGMKWKAGKGTLFTSEKLEMQSANARTEEFVDFGDS